MRATLDFLLHDWLRVESLCARARFAEHSRETFDAVLDLSERLAEDCHAPLNRLVDIEEPRIEHGRVRLPAGVKEALDAHAAAGLRSAGQNHEQGGMQLPYLVEIASRCFFMKASLAIDAYAMLSVANANLLRAHGTETQQRVFAQPQFEGRFNGTMCLSEPHAGSSLGDITTRAVPDGESFEADPLGPRYRLKGTKMWISAGEHELSGNIVHLVLAKIPNADGSLPPGVKGISLFVVPRRLLDANGALTGEHNDVALIGLNHKLGYRGTVNTLLGFGEGAHRVRAPGGLDEQGAGAIGYRVGAPGEGLRGMFHMMNEARIQVGLGATMLGFAGYGAALDYARNRPQGRPGQGAGKDPASPQRPIIEHIDVRRMLLAQKAWCEGGLALGLYCARLVDEKATGDTSQAQDAALLLELLTPIAKSWPSEWGLEANSLAIQVHGGYGYTRDFPVEQHWRDNRLNMIHEGTHGIQAQDLMGRKLRLQDGRAWALLVERMRATLAAVSQSNEVPVAALAPQAQALAARLTEVQALVQTLAHEPDRALRNAVPGLQAIGHLVVGWLWLDVAVVASRQLGQPQAAAREAQLRGTLSAMQHFFAHEMPRIRAWLSLLVADDHSAAQMHSDWF